jgi:hypothetical protein
MSGNRNVGDAKVAGAEVKLKAPQQRYDLLFQSISHENQLS